MKAMKEKYVEFLRKGLLSKQRTQKEIFFAFL